jgi:hypothetical protein
MSTDQCQYSPMWPQSSNNEQTSGYHLVCYCCCKIGLLLLSGEGAKEKIISSPSALAKVDHMT